MRTKLKVVSLLEAVAFAGLFGLVSYFVIYLRLADSYRLTAYIYNLIFLTAILLLDKAIDNLLEKKGLFASANGKIKRFLARAILALHLVSFKTGLYLFYIAMLVFSRISILAPHLVERYDIGFIYSVEYGVLLLLPIDKFIELLTKDDRRTRRVLSKQRAKEQDDGGEA